MMARVLVLLGSASDREYFEGTESLSNYFGFDVEQQILSAHRDSERLRQKLSRIKEEGTEVIIAAAGMAAHLAGVCAAETALPVIGVPLPGSALNGLDALLSTVQMPSGIPVATMAIGKAGAQNAFIFAARIFSLKDPIIAEKLAEFRRKGARL
jgi:phosphoribosylaminoimidazole carboxylase PurE protein